MAKKKAAPVFEPVTQQLADGESDAVTGEIGMDVALETEPEAQAEAPAPKKAAAKPKPAAVQETETEAETEQAEPETEEAQEETTEAEGETETEETETTEAEGETTEEATESAETEAAAEEPEAEAAQPTQEVAIAREFAAAMEDPDLRLAYYKNVIRRGGQLTPEHQEDFEALQQEAAPKKEAKADTEQPLTLDEARKKARKLIAEGKEDEAMLVMQDASPKQQDINKRLAEIEKTVTDQKNADAQRVRAARAREAQAKVQGEVQQIAKDFPHLIQIDAKRGVVVWKDPKFKEGMAKATDPRSPDYVGPNVSLGRVARLVLSEQGRLGKAQVKPKTPATKAPIAPAARTSEVRKKPELGEIAMETPIESA